MLPVVGHEPLILINQLKYSNILSRLKELIGSRWFYAIEISVIKMRRNGSYFLAVP